MWPVKGFQYYTNVNYRSCAACLKLHGRIAWRADRFPDPEDGCERAILPFTWRERKACKEKRRTMKRVAEAELARRDLFQQAEAKLADDPDGAVELFRRSAQIDVYVPEVEALVERQAAALRDGDLRERLRLILRQAFSDKFGRRRYERLPEVMRLEREEAGMRRIDELLG